MTDLDPAATHVVPQNLASDPTYVHDLHRIHGSIVRVHDMRGRPTAFVGVVTRMRRTPLGLVCDVGGGGRRLVVPLVTLARATASELPTYANVHGPELGKSPMAIDGQESEL